MELLVIKTGSRYLRVKDDDCTAVGLDKASVFPMAMLETVKVHLAAARAHGFPEAVIFRLTLTETPL
ncbi:hypothetical protein [Desulfosarcina ovata]|uniref:Uncharacterized protein n=1 Tax=Desulfosarcina ovata subsp. ovata TaxID=2752305 RepID=A0A5K8ABZ5_9BACT|nr:hypothetical protein [Desulfosarcina ovata]BBO90137.1 hypothetical protein DSCOOX_33170 [Desulfosarcina ovata subsp. ovata]